MDLQEPSVLSQAVVRSILLEKGHSSLEVPNATCRDCVIFIPAARECFSHLQKFSEQKYELSLEVVDASTLLRGEKRKLPIAARFDGKSIQILDDLWSVNPNYGLYAAMHLLGHCIQVNLFPEDINRAIELSRQKKLSESDAGELFQIERSAPYTNH